jgi:hypothetical protein
VYVCVYVQSDEELHYKYPIDESYVNMASTQIYSVRTVDASRYDYSHNNIVSMNCCTSNYAERLRQQANYAPFISVNHKADLQLSTHFRELLRPSYDLW